MSKRMNSYKRHNGGALVVVIMIMFVVMILGTIILQISVAETRFSVREKNRIEAYYLAKSGVEATADWLLKPENDLSLILNKTSTVKPLDGSSGEFFVEVLTNESEDLLILKGTGVVNGVKETATMTVHRVVNQDTSFNFDYALYAGTYLKAQGSVSVPTTTPVGYGDEYDIHISNSPGSSFPVEGDGGSLVHTSIVYDLPLYPTPTESQGHLTVNGSVAITFDSDDETITYDSISLTNDSTLTINTGTIVDADDDTVNLLVGSLDLKGTGSSLIISGQKKLKIFFDGNVEVRSSINPGPPIAPDKLLFLTADSGSFVINNNGGDGTSVFNAFVYAPNASFEQTGNSSILGALIFNAVKINGTVSFSSVDFDPTDSEFEIVYESDYTGGSWID